MQKLIVFLDALDYRELSGWLARNYQGRIQTPPIRVTPAILGSVYTGKTPGEHGLVRPTPLYRNNYQKPDGELIMEKLSKKARVLSWNMPFTMGIQLQRGIAAPQGLAGNGNAPPALFLPFPAINMGNAVNDDEQAEKYFQSFVDHARTLFSTARQLIRANASDIFVLSFRGLDSWTHWLYKGDYRHRLIQYLSLELSEFEMMGDKSEMSLLYFSDHGGTPATNVFRVNKWLAERGYLNLSVHEKRHREQIKSMEDNGQKPWKHQIDLQSPLVQIDDYLAYSTDAFDSCIDVNPEASQRDIDALINDLKSTGAFDNVYRKEELYPESEKNGKLPAIIPERKPGVLVSGNVHPEVPTWGFTEHRTVVNTRSGDHSKFGCFGGTVDLGAKEVIRPEELYGVIESFCKDVTESEEKAEGQETLTPGEKEGVRKRLEQLGYI